MQNRQFLQRPEICYCDFPATSGLTFSIFYYYLRPQSRTDRSALLLLLACFSLLSPSHLSRQVYYCPFGFLIAEVILSIDVHPRRFQIGTGDPSFGVIQLFGSFALLQFVDLRQFSKVLILSDFSVIYNFFIINFLLSTIELK